MAAEMGAHQDTVVVFACTDSTSHNRIKRRQNIPETQWEQDVRSEHENSPVKLYCGIKLELFPPSSVNVISPYSTQERKLPNDHYSSLNDLAKIQDTAAIKKVGRTFV